MISIRFGRRKPNRLTFLLNQFGGKQIIVTTKCRCVKSHVRDRSSVSSDAATGGEVGGARSTWGSSSQSHAAFCKRGRRDRRLRSSRAFKSTSIGPSGWKHLSESHCLFLSISHTHASVIQYRLFLLFPILCPLITEVKHIQDARRR